MGTLLFQSSKRDEQNKERKMDENNVNGFNDMDDDEDEGILSWQRPCLRSWLLTQVWMP